MVAGMVVHAGEGLEVEEGALVGDGVSEVVREEEIGVCGTDLVSGGGSVLARRWSVVVRVVVHELCCVPGCERWWQRMHCRPFGRPGLRRRDSRRCEAGDYLGRMRWSKMNRSHCRKEIARSSRPLSGRIAIGRGSWAVCTGCG